MSNGIRTCIVSTVFALLLLQACSQEPAHDPLAYTPTGDALWDTYAQALLEQLPNINADFGLESSEAVILPDELLASWESEFGSDPKYWQMRFWNKVHLDHNVSFRTWAPDMFEWSNEYTGPDSVFYLLQGKELGSTNLTTELLLYQYLDWRLDYIQENYEVGSQIEDEYFDIPQFDDLNDATLWFDEQKQSLANELDSSFPDESWVWYQRAMRRFDSDEWEAGLDDLRSGNQAKFNRNPNCFPMSYVAVNVSSMPRGGNAIAAGIVVDSFSFGGPFTGFYLGKLADSQLNRISDGSDLSELAAWHQFACRYGSMDNVSAGDWLRAEVITVVLLKYLLTEIPESLTVKQRKALLRLNYQVRKISNLVMYDLQQERPEESKLMESIQFTLSKHGFEADPWDVIGDGIDGLEENPGLSSELIEVVQTTLSEYGISADPLDIIRDKRSGIEKNPVLNLTLHQIHFLEQLSFYEAEYVTVAAKAKKQFEKVAAFDFATCSWPET